MSPQQVALAWLLSLSPVVIPIPGASRPESIEDSVQAAELELTRGRAGGDRLMRTIVITPYRDGPLLVRGPVRLTDQDGNEIAIDRGTIALCRCGKSRLRPFCDGTHKLVRFRAPSGPRAGASRPPEGGRA